VNTESSPEELELGVSWPPGEYCSKGTDKSRYSCWQVGAGQDNVLHCTPFPTSTTVLRLCPCPRARATPWGSKDCLIQEAQWSRRGQD
jgi:hypothetical protein